MKNKLLIYSLLSLFSTTTSTAQEILENVDSLFEIHNNTENPDTQRAEALAEIANHYMFNTPQKSKQYGEQYQVFSKKIGYATGVARSYLLLGNLHDYGNRLDSAKILYQLGYDKYTELKDTFKIGTSLDCLANIEYKRGNYQASADSLWRAVDLCKRALGKNHINVGKYYSSLGILDQVRGHDQLALNHYLKALKIYETTPFIRRIANINVNIASVEIDLEHYEAAVPYLKKAIELLKSKNDLYFLSYAHQNLGHNYYYLKKYELAETHYLQAIEMGNQVDNFGDVAIANKNLSVLYTEKRQFAKALKLLEIANIAAQKSKTKHHILGNLNMFGWTYSEMNQPQKAVKYYNHAVLLADSIQAINHLKDAYFHRSKAQEAIGNTALAFSDFKHYETLKDSILNTTKLQQIEELRILHNLEQKEQSIALQQHQIALLEKDATLSRLQKWLLGLGLGLSMLILGVGYYGFRQKLAKNKLQKEQQKLLYEKELAFKKRELTAHALHLAKKNEVLGHLKQKAISLKAVEKESQGYQKLINTIDFDLKDEDNWENFKNYFEQIHKDFNSTVLAKHPKVTSNDLRLMALLKMNLSSKEIANILNISAEGVKKARQRLRKKLGLTPADSLEKLIMAI